MLKLGTSEIPTDQQHRKGTDARNFFTLGQWASVGVYFCRVVTFLTAHPYKTQLEFFVCFETGSLHVELAGLEFTEFQVLESQTWNCI